MRLAENPRLYDPSDPVPMLRGTRCQSCESTFFPPLGVGCEVCGAPEDRLRAVSIAATGVLHSLATVNVYHGDDITPPFVVAEIQLDEGPLIRGIVTGQVELDAIGRRVAARWSVVRINSAGNEIVEPRFFLAATTDVAGAAR